MKAFIKVLLIFSLIFIVESCNENSTNPIDPNSGLVSESEVLNEINLARTNPNAYIAFIEDMKQYFDGKIYNEPGETALITNEGVAALDEAIVDLQKYGDMQPLTLSVGMSKACRDHVKDCGNQGLVSHTGSDGSNPGDRFNRYGEWKSSWGECISFGSKTARKIVLQLIIDDGVPSRGHRKNIFTKTFTKLGAAFGSHKSYKYMCVVGFAGDYAEK